MTHPHKIKGNRVEREVVGIHSGRAKRVPLSGAVAEYPGDIEISLRRDINGIPITFNYRGEVKARRNGAGFKTLEGWMGTNDVLFLKRDRQPFLIVMTEKMYKELIQ